jgi:hypothetical protein
MKNTTIFLLAFSIVIFVFSCKKTNVIYTSKIAGMHVWHGTHSYINPSIPNEDTTYNYYDSFSITLINNTTLAIGLDTLVFISKYSSNDINTFIYSGYVYNFRYDSLVYTHSTNSIYLYRYGFDNGGGKATIIIHTP